MKIIILGAGQVGANLVEYLINDNNEIVLVDSDIEKLIAIQNQYDIKVVQGYASYPATLRDADAQNTDLLIAVTDSDETNMLACQLAYSLFKIPQKIARIRNNDYLSEKQILFNDKAIPIDNIIAPELLLTDEICNLIEYPGATQIADFANGRICIVCVKAYYGGTIVGYPINDLKNHIDFNKAKIVAIYRQGKSITVNNNTIIEAEDEIYFVSAKGHIKTVMGTLQKIVPPYRRIMVVGGGDIGKNIATKLSEKYSIKLVESNEKKAKLLADEFDRTKVEVFNSDPTNTEFLHEEHVNKIDLVVAVTDNDEKNIMAALLTKSLGANKSIVLIKNYVFANVIQGESIDVVISPQEATISALLTDIRRNGTVCVHTLRRGDAESIEIQLKGNSENNDLIGRQINEISFPSGCNICAIYSDENIIIAHGDEILKEGDNVIFMITDKRCIKDLIKLASPKISFFE